MNHLQGDDDMNVRPFLINNEWTIGGAKPIVSINPADGSEVATVGRANKADVEAAIAAARAALKNPAWRDLKPHERAKYLYRMGDLLSADAERIARLQTKDNGKTIRETRGQVASAANTFRYYASVCETFESHVTPSRGNYWTMTVYEPVGVVSTIAPWNSPITLEAQKLAPALAAGNTVVHKPSSTTPMMALEYARIAVEAKLPPGVLNVVIGSSEVGDIMVEHPDVRMVSFTGGTEVGRRIAEICGRRLIPSSMELGGKSPHIVFADADLKKAIPSTGDGIFSGAGQSCVAGSRIFVEESVYEDYLAGLKAFAEAYRIGVPDDEATDMGPLASFSHRETVEKYVELGRQDGAKLVTGGSRPKGGAFDKGAYYTATILTGVDNRARVAREEIFGPVAVVIPFKNEADLIAQANDTNYGLASGVWTRDYPKAWRVARALEAGTVWINTYKQLSITTPFGGFKESGMGREKGYHNILHYMQEKGIYWGL